MTKETQLHTNNKILIVGRELSTINKMYANLESIESQVELVQSDFHNILFLLEQYRSSVLIIYSTELDAELYAQLKVIQEHLSIPTIVQLSKEREGDIERALAVGVCVFLSGDVNLERLPSIVTTAKVRHEQEMDNQRQTQKLKQQAQKLEQQLSDRKLIAKAKGLLMEKNALTENQAYDFLRSSAMQKNTSIAEFSSMIIQTYQ